MHREPLQSPPRAALSDVTAAPCGLARGSACPVSPGPPVFLEQECVGAPGMAPLGAEGRWGLLGSQQVCAPRLQQ